MAKKTFRFAKQIAVHEPSLDIPQETNQYGIITRMGTVGTRYIAAGEPVELEAAEGKKIEDQVGAYVAPEFVVQPGIIVR